MVKARALKNPITVERFWLLQEEETETFIKVNPSLNNSENNPDNSRKNDDNSEKKETKGKKRKGEYIYTAPPGKYFDDPSLNDAFVLYLNVLRKNGKQLQQEQISLLQEELLSLSDDTEEQHALVKKSTMKGWVGFFPQKMNLTRNHIHQKKGKQSVTDKNRFNNFPQRDNQELIRQLEAMEGVIKNEKENSGANN